VNFNTITIVAILAGAICSFGFLEYIMLAYWKAMGRTKGAPTSKTKKRAVFHRPKPGFDCFHACMKKFGWDVDEISFCASKCQA
jgi:hypothetical protein